MKKKILITIFILLLLISISKNIFAINDILDLNFDDLNNIPFKKQYGNYYGSYSIDDQKGILCVHDKSYTSNNTQYGTVDGTTYVSAYYYYDKIVINGDGKNPRKIEYSNAKGTTDETQNYKGTAAYMARLFYGRNSISDNWILLHQYRFFCVDYMARGFKNWCEGKGSFNYFVHEKDFAASATDSEYDSRYYNPITYSKSQEAMKLNRSCLEYSNFVSSLNGKYTIENKKHYKVADAINNKDSAEIDATENWSLDVATPYYKPHVTSGYYDNVVYQYAFIDSNNYNASSISWNAATVSNASDESGYENITLSGNANTNENANTLILKCSYKTYSGIALGFATWNGQERFLVNGKENDLISYFAYDIVSEPNVTISKKIVKINTTEKNVKSADVEIGDTVIFKVTVNNKGTATRTVKLTDDYDSGFVLKQVGKPNASNSTVTDWYNRTSWSSITETINPGDTIVRYFKFEVDESASGTIENIATITCDEELDSNGRTSKSAKASVSILEYNYKITKKVVSITNSREDVKTRINNDGETVNETSKAEPGDIVKFKITLRNYNKAKLKYVIIQDVLQEGLTLVDCYEASSNGGWEIIPDYSSNQATIKMTDGGSRGVGTKTFYVEARVDTAPVFDPDNNKSEIKLTNTATITQVQNKHKKNIRGKVEAEDLSDIATVKVLDYSYRVVKQVASITSGGVERTNNLDTVEKGDIIKYSIELDNLNEDCWLYEVHMKDILSDGLKYIDYDEPQNKGLYWEVKETSPNVVEIKMMRDTVSRKQGVKRFYIIAEVVKDINDTNKIIKNSVQATQIKNVNGKKLENVSDEVSVTMLSYDASLNKYITNHNGTNITDRVGVSNAVKFDNPVVVKQGDMVTYTIEFKNKGTNGTVIYNPQIEDILKPGLEYDSHSPGWTRNAASNTYTYNGEVGAKEGENTITLNITAKVTMSNIYLYNLKNEAKYGIVQNINGVDISSNLTLENNEDFVRLDELDIAGTVWEDINKDGIMDESEPKLSGITVILHNQTDGNTITKTTDENGNYKFNKETEVLKGTNRQANGNYIERISEHKKYYLEFVYDGVTYKSTKYSGKNNLKESDLSIKEDYKYDSNAAESKDTREVFNKNLEIISYNNAQNISGTNKIALEYERKAAPEEDTEKRMKSILKNRENFEISSYSFIDPRNGTIEPLWLDGTDGILKSNTEYLNYINLGLVNKDADLKVRTTVEGMITTINGQRLEYIRPEDYEDNYGGGLHYSDYEYKYDKRYAGNEDIMNLKGVESELNLELRYKTKISNDGKVNARVNELTQVYDTRFVSIFSEDEYRMRIDRNDDGIFEDDYVYEFEVYYEHLDSTGKEIINKGIATASINKKYDDLLLTEHHISEHNNIVYITGLENIILQPGESLDIFTTYLAGKDSERNIIVNHKYTIVSEINSYSTYEDVEGKIPAGSIDVDSNPGNLTLGSTEIGLKKTIDKTQYEDDTDKVCYQPTRFEANGQRIIEGTVWDDGNADNADGKLDIDTEEKIENVKVKLIEIIKYKDSDGNIKHEEFEVEVNPEYEKIIEIVDGKEKIVGYGEQINRGDPEARYVKTDSNGNYKLKNYIPGLYVVRFIYGNQEEDLKYNGQDYKSTKYLHENVENFSGGNENALKIAPSCESKYEVNVENVYPQDPILKNNKTYYELAEIAKNEEIRISDARDDEKRRLETIQYSIEMYNEKAEVLKYDGTSDKEKSDLAGLYMYADTATFITKIEVIPPKVGNDDGTYPIADYLIHVGDLKISETKYGKSMWYVSHEKSWKNDKLMIIEAGGNKRNNVAHKWEEWREAGKLYKRSIKRDYIDFGLQKRPENKLELQKYIKQIKLETSTGELFVDLYYDKDSNLLKPISKGFENVQALNNTPTHQGFRYINVDEDLLQGAKITIKYGFIGINESEVDYISKNLYGENFADKTTKDLKDSIEIAISNPRSKYENSKEYYGYYLGNNYYKGTPDPNVDVKVQLKIDNILDYVDNNLVFKPDENSGKWGTIKKDELISNGYLQEDVYMIEGHKLVADINGVEYQTDTKNNLAITIDDKTSNPDVSKFLLPEETIETELTVSTILSPENNTDDMVYENIAEIIKYTSMNGRRTVKEGSDAHTVGNAKIHYAGYKTDKLTSLIDGTMTYLDEPDTAIVEKVMLTPPTGKDLIDIYVFTKIVIYIINVITIIGVAIIIIPRIKRKMKSRY